MTFDLIFKIMKKLLTVVFVAISALAFSQEKEIKLFNGKNLQGWYAFEPTTGKHANASDLFSVENGIIKLLGSKPGYLMNETSFKNFKLKAEYRWNLDSTVVAASKKKNSGLMYLVPEETADTLWPQGIQFQIKEGSTGDFVLLQNVTLKVNGQVNEPGRSVVIKRTADAEKPFGEWNLLEVECTNGHIIQKINGVVVNEGTGASVSKGRIMLQYEGYPIDFRNIIVLE
jgi:hypothetical protein